MSLDSFRGLIALIACLVPFLLVQRWLHRQIQAVFLLITRRPALSLGLFSLIFFPGVLLHEVSHYLMARLLRVRTGRFSLIPTLLENGQLQLGFVETARVDYVRDALIGMAPLLTGGLAIAYLGIRRLGLVSLAGLAAGGDWAAFWFSLRAVPQLPDFWLWFYLAFTISSTMLPSASDRQAWLPLVLTIVALAAAALLAGAGPWMLANLAPRLDQGLRVLATVFGISLALHLALSLPVGLSAHLLSRLTGMKVV